MAPPCQRHRKVDCKIFRPTKLESGNDLQDLHSAPGHYAIRIEIGNSNPKIQIRLILNCFVGGLYCYFNI